MLKSKPNLRSVRKAFLDFFKRNGHEIVESSSLIPAEDPTLLFANAGMNQFKDLFLGKERRAYDCAATAQKCVRAGGKHNDLDNVGFTDRHLTFFEMMGNFSFGAYFKERAIELAWEFLTKDLGIPVEKLSVTVHTSDDESAEIWKRKVAEDKIARMGDEDNFWQMGDTGPCGPCTEIFYDRGEGVAEDERHIEVWNLVFMQFDRQVDGKLVPLKQKGVDTGMGLERLIMVLQGGSSVFDGDQFVPLREFLEQNTEYIYDEAKPDVRGAFNVLCDHVRSSSLIIADGGMPSNDGRGYVLRKIIRRAALFASKISDSGDLFIRLVPVFIKNFSDIFPELERNRDIIEITIKEEVDRFAENLSRGRRIFDSFADEVKQSGRLSGEQVFKLFDTFGFPTELTSVMAAERGLKVDMEGFEVCMEQQREQSGKSDVDVVDLKIPADIKTEFVGYDNVDCSGTVIWSEDGWVVTDQSPFYVESGGQVSDYGFVVVSGKRHPVLGLQKVVTSPGEAAIALKVDVSLKVGDEIRLLVDEEGRRNSAKNHTSAHLLQAALVAILGQQVRQAGSLVNDKICRFDFSHHQAVTPEEIVDVERLVNFWVQQAIPVSIKVMTLAEARDRGAVAFFGEKYNPESVRVVEVPGVSAELCGGTHVVNTGEIGAFKIVSEEALGVGVRRMTVVTGQNALEVFQDRFGIVQSLGAEFSVQPNEVLVAVQREREHAKELRKEVKALNKELLKLHIPEWRKKFEHVGNVEYVNLFLEDADIDLLRIVARDLTGAEPNGVVFAMAADKSDEKVRFVLGIGKDAQGRVRAEDAVKILGELGLRGGGKGSMVQGGGIPKNRDEVTMAVKAWVGKA